MRSDFKLQVKSMSQQIVVTSHQEVVSEDLTASSSMSGKEIDSLPLNFRATNAPSPIGTATLTAGVNEDPSGNLTFSGQLPTATSFTLDGTSVQMVRFGGPTRDLFPSVEGIAEFRVNTAGNERGIRAAHGPDRGHQERHAINSTAAPSGSSSARIGTPWTRSPTTTRR